LPARDLALDPRPLLAAFIAAAPPGAGAAFASPGDDGPGVSGHPARRFDRPPARPRRRACHRPGPGDRAAQLLVGQAAVHPRPARAAEVGLSLPPPDAEEARDRPRLLAADPARRETGAAPPPPPPGAVPPPPAPRLAR